MTKYYLVGDVVMQRKTGKPKHHYHITGTGVPWTLALQDISGVYECVCVCV